MFNSTQTTRVFTMFRRIFFLWFKIEDMMNCAESSFILKDKFASLKNLRCYLILELQQTQGIFFFSRSSLFCTGAEARLRIYLKQRTVWKHKIWDQSKNHHVVSPWSVSYCKTCWWEPNIHYWLKITVRHVYNIYVHNRKTARERR